MIRHFVDRVIENRDKDRIDNSTLPAGSPMYYYCRECREFLTSLPEEHLAPAPALCEACKRLKERELLPEARAALKEKEEGASLG
jgi:hypothetical protein